MTADKEALNVQVPTELKERLVDYATEHGISQTASTTILLDKALRDAGYPRKTR